jgi:hypothetical protein
VFGAVGVDDDIAHGEGVVGGALRGGAVGREHVPGAERGGGIELAGEGRRSEGGEAGENGHAQNASFGLHSVEPLKFVGMKDPASMAGSRPGRRCSAPGSRLCCGKLGNVMLRGNTDLTGSHR